MPIKVSPAVASMALRGAAAAVILAATLPGASAAASADCDKIAHSTVPYEITMKIGEIPLKYQVFRSDKHVTKLLIRQPDGNISQLENQGTFPKSVTMPDGQTATFQYSIPTDKPVYEQAVKTFNMKLMHDKDVVMDTPVALQYLPDEKIKVGACTYDTKHYVQTTSKDGRESRNEIWYSPDLEIGVKNLSALKAGGQAMSKQSEATDLTTEFKPFK